MLGVNYHLYTAFPFVERMVFDKAKAPIMPLREQKSNPAYYIPRNIIDKNLHTIQDSGIFTLLFGARKNIADEKIIARWYDALVQYTLENAQGATIVEIDCQDIIGVEKAWEYRERLAKDLPGFRIINVWHPVGGVRDLDRLIEFSDYISFSSLAFKGKERLHKTAAIVNYIKTKRPNLDIHILGCTTNAILEVCKHCTSCDSTTWTGVKRFGFINGYHQSRLKTEEVKKLVPEAVYSRVNEYNSETNTNGLLTNIIRLQREYERVAGSQDYYVGKQYPRI